MGLFYDRCESIVDQKTGRALSGNALAEAMGVVSPAGAAAPLCGKAKEKALAAYGWGVCGHKVSKRARVCSRCGTLAPNGYVKCPSCREWVGNESKYCPHCNHPLYPEERIDLAGGVWVRKPGEFARRFELDDVRFLKENGLIVQEGTVAVLLDGGKEVNELGPGRHHPTGTLRTINWFGDPPPRSAVIIDASECVFRVDFTGKTSGVGDVKSAPLRSSEELEVGCIAEVTLRFVSGRADKFIANVMKEARSVSMKEVCGLLYENALSAVRDLCTQSTIEDLVKDPDRRERFEEAITRSLRERMKDWGLEIVRTGAVEFYGAAYEEIRAKYGDLERTRRLVEFGKAQLDVLAASADQEAAAGKRDAQRDLETKEYLEQLAQEKQLSEIERTQALQIADRVAKGDVSAAEAKLAAARELEDHAKNMTALAHKLELDLTLRNYNREQAIIDAEHKARLASVDRDERLKGEKLTTAVTGEKLSQAKLNDEIERVRISRELWEADQYLDLRRKKDSIKNAELRERSDILAGKSELELAALSMDDPQARQAFLEQELAKLRMKQEMAMSPEQLLARQAGASDSAAQALARMAEAGERATAQVLEERRRMDAERLAHDEKLGQQIIELAKAAVERQSTTIVPPAPVTNMQH